MTTAMPHHHDSILSAVLDGEADSDESTHVASCDVCSLRLEQLREASIALADVPPVDPDVRDQRVRTAIKRGSARLVVGGARDRDRSSAAAPRRSTPPPWAVAAAAVAALVAVVFGIGSLLTSESPSSNLVQGEHDALAGAGADAGFLGAFTDDRRLADELTTQLGGATPRADGSGQGGFFAPEAGGAATAGDAEALSPAQGLDGAVAPPPEPLTDEQLADCATAQQAEFSGQSEPLLVGRILWKGEAAAVFVHRLDSGGPRSFGAWVYAGDPCALRTFISF